MKKIFLIFLIMAVCSPAYALTGLSFGIKGGKAINTDLGMAEGYADIDNMTLLGGQLKVCTLPAINLIGTVEYAWAKQDLTGFDGEMKFHDLSFTASVVYPFKFQVIKPYAGIGVGTHMLAYTIESSGFTLPIPQDETLFGYHLLGGFDVGFATMPFSLTGEARMNWVKTEGELTKYFQITLGLNFSMM